MDLWKCVCPVCSERGVSRFMSLFFVLRCVSCGAEVERSRRFPGIHGVIEAFLVLGSVLAAITMFNPIPFIVGIAAYVIYKHTMPLKSVTGPDSD